MLLRTLFVLVLIATLTETVVHGVGALAAAALRRQALVAVREQIATSTTLARDAVARAVAAGADPRAPEPQPPSPAPACRLRGQHGCAIAGVATISFARAVTGPPEVPAPCPRAACTAYAQANDAIDEGRIDATIRAQAVAAGGAVLASRTVRLRFRTLRVAPFAALAGQDDESLEASSGGPGDDAGAAPNGTAPGTLIDVLYENAATGATLPANVWRPQVRSASTTPPAWSP